MKILISTILGFITTAGYCDTAIYSQLTEVAVIPIIRGDDPEQTREAIEEELSSFGEVTNDNPLAEKYLNYLIIESFADENLPVITVRMKLKAPAQLSSNPEYPVNGIVWEKQVLVDGYTKNLGKVQKVVREMLGDLKTRYSRPDAEVHGGPVPHFYVARVKTS